MTYVIEASMWLIAGSAAGLLLGEAIRRMRIQARSRR